MKKILPLIVVGLLVLGGLGAVARTVSDEENFISEEILFSQPVIRENAENIEIELSEATSDSWETGKPMLPVVTKVYTLPFGTHVDSVDVTFSDTIEKDITKPIKVSPESIMKTPDFISVNIEESKTADYSGINVYPEKLYNYRTGGGLDGEEHVTYLAVSLYPVQYTPNQNMISYSKKATIEIEYTPPANPITFGDEYDLLIIAPSQFESALQRLVDHKNQNGIDTILTTLDEIPSGVGVDEQEDIKYYVKDAIETMGISYLLLVGAGLKDAELFPVRYAWIPSSPYEDNFASDLYYADIYDGEGNFSDWDKDGDGRYAEYPTDVPNTDVLPDVHLGKLPANNVGELNTVIDKIIWYDEHNKMTNEIVQIGGDTFPGDGEGIYEGEFANEEVLSELSGYSSTRLWGSNGKMTKSNIAKGFRSSADFMDFSGHGSWASWATHAPDDDEVWIPAKSLRSPYTGFLYVDFDLYWTQNSKKYSVVFYNACSTNKYTDSETCLSWKTLFKKNGGGIAAFGATGIGYGIHGSSETERLMGWMEVRTFKEIHDNVNLGLAWSNAITGYYTTFSANLNDGDYKTMLELSMFADPTIDVEDGDDPVNVPTNIPEIPGFLGILFERFPRLAVLLELILARLS